MRVWILILIGWLVGVAGAGISNGEKEIFISERIVERIAFGSCHNPVRGGEIWDLIRQKNPSRLVLLGDTVYADKKELFGFKVASPEDIRYYYGLLEKNPYWQRLVKSLGGWNNINVVFDDHDYGINNGDKNYIHRNFSQEFFFNFTHVPMSSQRRSQNGVYSSQFVQVSDSFSYKIIMMDSRSNKDPKGSKNGDFLGDEQWRWIENELLHSHPRPDVILLGSSIQILPNDKTLEENWSEFPDRRQQLITLIAKAQLHTPVVLLSGDIHSAEILRGRWKSLPSILSSQVTDDFTPSVGNIIEFTSSGLSHTFSRISTSVAVPEALIDVIEAPETSRGYLKQLMLDCYQALGPHSYRFHRYRDQYQGIHFALLDILEHSTSAVHSQPIDNRLKYYSLRLQIIDHHGMTVIHEDFPLNSFRAEDSVVPVSTSFSSVAIEPLSGPPAAYRLFFFYLVSSMLGLIFVVIPIMLIGFSIGMFGLYGLYQREYARQDRLMKLHSGKQSEAKKRQ